jgi:two-component system, NarL family, response regulator YdfI
VIRVLVGSRSSTMRAALEKTIRSSPTLELAGAVDPDGLAVSNFYADVLLLDVSDHDSLEFTDLAIPMVLLLDDADSDLVSLALRSGIRGVISRDATPQEIEGAVNAVASGLVAIAPGSLVKLLPDAAPFAEDLVESLTDRELEVLDLLAEGLSNKLIAHGLTISEHTVKTHVASIFAKLGASSRTEAVSKAIQRGLVML